MGASAKAVDFSSVKDGGGAFSPRRVEAGDYAAKIIKVEDSESKKTGEFQYIFTIKLHKYSQNSYPYYCKLTENQLWKLRNLLVAGGMNVPKKRIKLDPNKVVGKDIGVTMEDDEYEGKLKSVINAVFPVAELATDDIPDDSGSEEDFEEGADEEIEYTDDSVDEAPADDEDEEEEEEEEEEEDETPDELAGLDRDALKRRLRKASPGVSVKRNQTDDDLRDLIRAAEGKSSSKADDEDEDLEELDLDDL